MPAIPAAGRTTTSRASRSGSRPSSARARRACRTIAAHLVGAGGKRIRPTRRPARLPRRRARPGARDATTPIEAAVALELIHSATLLHDDIIDGGETRRGRPVGAAARSASPTRWSPATSSSAAPSRSARASRPRSIRWAAEACVSLTEGEIMQGRFRRNPAVTVGRLRRDHPAEDGVAVRGRRAHGGAPRRRARGASSRRWRRAGGTSGSPSR